MLKLEDKHVHINKWKALKYVMQSIIFQVRKVICQVVIYLSLTYYYYIYWQHEKDMANTSFKALWRYYDGSVLKARVLLSPSNEHILKP